MLEGNKLLRLTDIHVDEVSKIFTEIFMDYPLFSYMVEDPYTRPRIYPYLFQLMVKHTVRFGEAYATSEDMEGIALWLPSEKSDISIWSNLSNGGIGLLLNAGIKVAYRSMVFTEFASRLHHDLLTEPHIYLFQIGVKEGLRGKGYAGKLMRPIMERADREGLPIYLETHDPSNFPVYEHYQFETVRHEVIPDSEVNHWAMIRSPQQ
jgi:GNAT superfamily N-acetyltransferase